VPSMRSPVRSPRSSAASSIPAPPPTAEEETTMHGHHRPRPAPLSTRPADLQVRTGGLPVRTADPRIPIGDTQRHRGIDPPPPRPPPPGARRLRLDPAVRTFLAVMALLWLIWLVARLTTGAAYPWPIWPMLGRGGGPPGPHHP